MDEGNFSMFHKLSETSDDESLKAAFTLNESSRVKFSHVTTSLDSMTHRSRAHYFV